MFRSSAQEKALDFDEAKNYLQNSLKVLTMAISKVGEEFELPEESDLEQNQGKQDEEQTEHSEAPIDAENPFSHIKATQVSVRICGPEAPI